MIHYMSLHPQPYFMIACGKKTIELRLLDEKRKRICVGDTLIFKNTQTASTMFCIVKALHVFADFAHLYRSLPLDKCGYLPQELASASAKDMEAYYPAEKQGKYGVVGIEIELAQPTKTLLITGFDPFGGASINPSWEAVQQLPDRIGSVQLVKLQLPTVFDLAAQNVKDAANTIHPDAILCIGQAGGRGAVTPEVMGVNLQHAGIADNNGNVPRVHPIVPGGFASLYASVPVRDMVRAVRAAGVPCALSYTAGRFVCNDLLYSLLHQYRNTPVKVGFVHVPYLPEQAKNGEPSMTTDEMVRALIAAITVI